MTDCKVIAITNQKGGVGKTTTAVNLGVGLVREAKIVHDTAVSVTDKIKNIGIKIKDAVNENTKQTDNISPEQYATDKVSETMKSGAENVAISAEKALRKDVSKAKEKRAEKRQMKIPIKLLNLKKRPITQRVYKISLPLKIIPKYHLKLKNRQNQILMRLRNLVKESKLHLKPKVKRISKSSARKSKQLRRSMARFIK